MARRSLDGTVTWLPAGTSALSTSIDPGAVYTTVDICQDRTVTADAVTGANAPGAAAAAYAGFLVATSDGIDLTAEPTPGTTVLTTGHPYFSTLSTFAGNTWVQAVVTAGYADPPMISDSNGFTWTQVAHAMFGDAQLTMWTAPIDRDTASTGERVLLDQIVDSGIGFALHGQVP
jgi:hypothetical protein